MAWTVAKEAGAVAFTNWLARDEFEAEQASGQPSFYRAHEPITLKRLAEASDPFSAEPGPVPDLAPHAGLFLGQSTAVYEDLLNRLPMMIHIVDGQGRIQSTNEAAALLLGFSCEALIGQPALKLLTKPSRKRIMEDVLPEFLRTGYFSNVDVEFATRSGGTVDCLMSAIGYRSAQGRIERSIAVFADMSQRATALAALERSEERFRKAEAHIRQAHRAFGDLLTVIIGNLQLLDVALQGNAKAEKRAREAFLAATKASKLTKQLLDLAFPATWR